MVTCSSEYQKCVAAAKDELEDELKDIGDPNPQHDPLEWDMHELRAGAAIDQFRTELQLCRLEYRRCLAVELTAGAGVRA